MLIALGIRNGGRDVHLQKFIVCRMVEDQIRFHLFQ